MNPAYYSVIVALVALLYTVFFAPSRADKKELEKRLSKLELDDANHEQRLAGFSVQLERLGDHVSERCGKIETQLSEVGRMREDLAVVKARMEGQMESMNEIKGTIREIFNLLRINKN